MKKILSMLMILALLLGSMGAIAESLSADEMEAAESVETFEGEEEIQEVYELHGEIIEITDEYVLINTADMGSVQVNLSEDTVIEGVDALELGQTAVVMYNGMMTRSLPPQVTALHIGVYAVSGVITEVLEDSIVIIQDETGEEIVLTLPVIDDLGENEELLADEELAEQEEYSEELLEDEEMIDEEEIFDEELTEDSAPLFAVGDKIIAYTTGAMTMSLPPQMNALSIVFDFGEATPGEAEEMMEEIEKTEEAEEAEESDESVG